MIKKWETLSKSTAREITDTWRKMPNEGFEALIDSWKARTVASCPITYMPLREKLVYAYDNLKSSDVLNNAASDKKTYQFEYRYALEVYDILNKEGMSVRTASDDDVWRFITVNVVPDLIYDRWQDKNNPRVINADRYYDGTRRIWLKVLWWYIYLCWQGDREMTDAVISTNNANEISQLVERVGVGGYRVELFRKIMLYYGTKIAEKTRKQENNLLSRVLHLNIAWSTIIDPDLVSGGVDVYIATLFSYFGY